MTEKKSRGALAAIGDTPLIDLPALSPDGGATIHAKWEGANPTGSVKDRMALAMVEEARRRGDLRPEQPVVEFTGGSTGSSLALVCSALSHPISVVTADCVAEEKIASMRALGAELHVIETPERAPYDGLFDDLRDRAEEIESEQGAYFTDQFENPDQLAGYEALGREILEDCPDVTEFVMTVGTAGCAMGTARALRAEREVRVTLVEPEESPVISEERTGSHDVQGTAIVGSPPLLDPDLFDRVVTVPASEGSHWACELAAQEGLLAGTSTGMNLAAARHVAAERDGDEHVVTIACDTGLKYLSEGLYEGLSGPTFCLC
ncbi:PLP-dependent cysteine synthase family protein [Natronorarus salvus]|uniref:PLP-dependent cysteine synthase family protein n=1 Tax=Natronorarus salvus TaxID=3117733 RepID=UPI002F2695F7